MGRPKGSRNKTPASQRKVAEDGITPIEYLLKIVRDEKQPQSERMKAARNAAPYIHPRLSQVDQTVTHRRSPTEYTDAELIAFLEGDGAEGGSGEARGEAEPTELH